jgi:uncharacterized oxidoreductase
VLFRFEPIQSFAADLLGALGAPAESASTVAASLIDADLRGRSTHGVAMLPLYAEMIAAKAIDPSAQPAIEHVASCMISVAGRSAFGQVTGRIATATGIDIASKRGVAVIGLRDGSHIGRLGQWAEQAAAAGFVFMAFCNAGGGARNVAPFGNHERKLSTNPIAFGIPTFDTLPFDVIADFATSQVSGAVIGEHFRAGTGLNDEWTTTASGEPLATAEAFMEGEGALLPLGGHVTGHKGYALAVIAELLSGIAGGAVVGEQEPEWFSNGGMWILIDPTNFISIREIESRVASVAEHLRGDGVRLPGEGSHQHEITARERGLEIPGHVLASMSRLAKKLDVDMPTDMVAAAATSCDAKNNLKTW